MHNNYYNTQYNPQVESKRTELLKHPLIYSLIDHKWKYEMVMLFFYISLVCYLLFAVLLTTFALQLPNPLSPTCTYAYGSS